MSDLHNCKICGCRKAVIELVDLSGEGNGNPLQYSCLENSVDREPVFLPGESNGQRSLAGYGPWGCKELDMTERLSHLLTNRLRNINF